MRHARQCQKRPITVSKETRRPPQHCWPHDGDDVCLMLSCSDISLIVREQARVFRMYPPPHLKWTERQRARARRAGISLFVRERARAREREGGRGGRGGVGERDLRDVKSINILLTDMWVIHTVIGQVSTFYTTKAFPCIRESHLATQDMNILY